jgi:hypothetical protein
MEKQYMNINETVQNERKSDWLKVIAMVTMLIDHVAYYLVPHDASIYLVMRIIGRIAFPIFAYYVATGYKRTSDINKYMVRMFVFALITQVPFYFFSHGEFYLNVMFTFFMALLMLRLYERNNLLWVVMLFLADVANMDYGAYGLLIILIFYLFGDNKKKSFMFLLLLSLIYDSLRVLEYGNIHWTFYIQSLCVMAVPIIYFKFKQIRINKYISYLFYPVHISIIVLIEKFL